MSQVLGPRIWIVEDEVRHRVALRRLFRVGFQDCQVSECRTAEAAWIDLSKPGTPLPHLMVIDLLLPESTQSVFGSSEFPGLELVRKIRTSPHLSQVSVIIRSGFAEEVPESLVDGLTQVFTKGDALRELLDMSGSMMAIHGFSLKESPGMSSHHH